MGILSDFERRLEGVIEGFFTKAFRTGVQPVELANRILKDMEANKTVGVREVWVPNHYRFQLSPPDHEKFQQTEKALRRELEHVVRDAAEERGWGLVGPPQVDLEMEENLRQGEFACESSLVEAPSTGQPPAQPDGRAAAEPDRERDEPGRAAQLVLLDRGRAGKTFPLAKERVIIGRMAECDVVVPDPGASRRHAEVRSENGEFVISDLGSMNGTMVNEASIGERTLREGDRITIGRTVLEFRRE